MSETKKTTKKKAAPVEAEVMGDTGSILEPKTRSVLVGTIFWGFAFILFGVLLLLSNLKVVDVNFMNLWQLWPVMIIGVGISMLSLRGWLAGLVATLMVVALGFLVYLVAVENPYYSVSDDSSNSSERITVHEGKLDPAAREGLDIQLVTGAIGLTLASNADQKSFVAELQSNNLTLSEERSEVQDGVQHVKLVTGSDRRWWLAPINNRLRIELSEQTPLALRVETGASSLDGDLSQVFLKQLAVKAGASSIDLKLGTKIAEQEVTIDAGASRVQLSVPRSAGVRVEADSGLSGTDFETVEKVSDDVYESTDFSSAEKRIVVRVKLGVSSFRLVRY